MICCLWRVNSWITTLRVTCSMRSSRSEAPITQPFPKSWTRNETLENPNRCRPYAAFRAQMLPVHPPQELKARSCGDMEHSAFTQCVIEHRAAQMLPLLHICSGIHDHIDRHRNVPQYQ